MSYIHVSNHDEISRKPKLVLLLSSLLFRHSAETSSAQESAWLLHLIGDKAIVVRLHVAILTPEAAHIAGV